MTKKQAEVKDQEPVVTPAVEPEVTTEVTEPAGAAQEVSDAAEGVGAPTAPSFAASKSNIAYMKTPANPLGALNTGIGYAPDVLVTATQNSQLIGGAAEVVGYAAPTPQ